MSLDSQETRIDGTVVAVRGAVVDVIFPDEAIPAINDALEAVTVDGRRVLLEVEAQRDRTTVRTIALHNTNGSRAGSA